MLQRHEVCGAAGSSGPQPRGQLLRGDAATSSVHSWYYRRDPTADEEGVRCALNYIRAVERYGVLSG